MYIAKTKIPPDVLAILARSAIAGKTLTLPEQLDRETYVKVAKVLKATGGKWDRKSACHLFDFDPRELMGAAIDAGVFIDQKKTLQFFETPHELAIRMVRMARIGAGELVLEPSAGRGRIVRHLVEAGARVVAVEIDDGNCKALRDLVAPTIHADFLTYAMSGVVFDAVVMNPPFSNGQDMLHIRAAWELLRAGGRMVAVCSEGPFFREDKAATEFRAWLDEIGAVTEQLSRDTFLGSGTSVLTRLITAQVEATKPGRAHPVAEDQAVRNIPISQVTADPGQPRKRFERAALRELAASIAADGLLQPITVRQIRAEEFMVVAGERRYRASVFNGAQTIRAIVIEATDPSDIRVKQIIENDQRVDVTPLEQARSYQALMAESGMTVDQLAARIGKAPYRIAERIFLLRLAPEHQHLLESGNLKPSEAYELARLAPRGAALLFKAIRTGKCATFNDLRVMSNALFAAEGQTSLLPDSADPISDGERSLATGFEAHVERIAALLRAGITDNQIIAVRRVDPHRAGYLADLIGVMQKDMRRLEVSLREMAVQASLLEA